MNYDNKLVEKIIMDLSSTVEELEHAWRNNPCAVRENITHLRDSKASLGYIVTKILRGAL